MNSSVTTAAVIGAGPIGCATAGHLARQGIRVRLCDVDSRAVDPVCRSGRVVFCGELEGEGTVQATSDPSDAVQGADLVVTAVPASAHEAVARAVAPALRDGALILIQPGQTLSAVAFMRAAREAGLEGDPTPVETLNTLFTARLRRPGEVEIFAVKRHVPFAALPASRTGACARRLQPLFENLLPATSVLEVGLHNMNAVLHPPISLLNVGLIDSGTEFRYYMDGATRQVMRLVEAVDRERQAILRALGLPCLPLLHWFEKVYGVCRPDLHGAVMATRPYESIAAPGSMDTRLLLEDVPTGLVPCASIAGVAGVEVPVMRAIVETCCRLYGIDFWNTGRTLPGLGLGHLGARELLEELGPAS